MMDLKNIPTCKLFEELKTREGVLSKEIGYNEPIIYEYGESEEIKDGPCTLLVVFD